MLLRLTFIVLLFAAVLRSAHGAPAADGPLMLESKIPLGVVQGRIDHLSADLARQRLFVAELGNGSVGVVDLQQGKLLDRVNGLKEPQGVNYDAGSDTLYVASAGDGTLRRYISEFSVTGLTSNPSIFEHAIKNGSAYDSAIRIHKRRTRSGNGDLLLDCAGSQSEFDRVCAARGRRDLRAVFRLESSCACFKFIDTRSAKCYSKRAVCLAHCGARDRGSGMGCDYIRSWDYRAGAVADYPFENNIIEIVSV